MSKLPAALFLSAAVLGAALVYAETPGQDTITAPAPASVSETAAPAVVSKMHIEIKGDLLSIDLVDAEFGSVMRAISARTGIKVDITGPIQQKRLTTKFSGIELERGISRLMTLVKEKNYSMKYDTSGKVSAIELYAIEPEAVSSSRTPARPETQKTMKKTLYPASPEQPVPTVQKNPPQQRRLLLPSKQTVQQPEKPKKPEPDIEGEGEESVEELPYIAPQKKIPAATKQLPQ